MRIAGREGLRTESSLSLPCRVHVRVWEAARRREDRSIFGDVSLGHATNEPLLEGRTRKTVVVRERRPS